MDVVVNATYQPWVGELASKAHQVHARHPDLPSVWMADFMLTDMSGGSWHYRRDPSITMPLERARRVGRSGLPHLAPEAALLFKAAPSSGTTRPKDLADFANVEPTLTAEARAWLRRALERTQPGHAWLKALE